MCFKEDRALTGQLDGDGEQQSKWKQEEHHQGREADIEGPFQEAVGIDIEGEGPHLEEGDIAEAADLEMDLLAAREIGNEVGADAIPFRNGDEGLNFLHFAERQNDK